MFTAQDEYGNSTSEINQTGGSTWLTGVLALLSALNIFLSITATLGNALILAALRKETSLHPPTKLLFQALAVTDFCAGLTSQPLFAVAVMTNIVEVNYSHDWYIVTAFILCGISLLTSTAISVDRLLALLLGLKYRDVVTLRRTRVVIVCFFVTTVLCVMMHFWNASAAWIAIITFGVVCLITSIFSYTKIYLTLRQHQAQVHEFEHANQGQEDRGRTPLNIARYKKTVSSIAWVQMVLVACYIPYLIVSILRLSMKSNERSLEVIYFAAVTQIYLNSSLNPILYCWKNKEVRRAAKAMISQVCCYM